MRALRVQLVGGRVDVVAHDEPGARLEVHDVDGRPLEVQLDDGELRVGYTFTLGGWEGWLEKFKNFRDRDRADVSIAVPRSAVARVGTVSADGPRRRHPRARLGLDRLRLARRRRHPRAADREHRLGRDRRPRATTATSA